MGSIVLLFVIALAIVAGLASGPVSLGFLAPYVEQTFESQYPDINLDFTDLELEWNGRDKNLVVGVDNLVISKIGRRVASIPDVSVTFSAEALLRGQIAPSELEFTGLQMRLTRTQNGEVKFGYEYGAAKEAEKTNVAEQDQEQAAKDLFLSIVDELSGEPNKDTVTGYLKRLEFYNSSVFVEDEILDKFWRARDVDLFLWREQDGLHAQASGGLKIGEETISIIALADYDRDKKLIAIDGKFNDLPLFVLADQAPGLAALSGVNIAVSGHINMDMDQHFGVSDIGFDLTSGAGQIDIPELYKQPLDIENAVLSGSISSEFDTVSFEKVAVNTLGSTLNMTGSLSFSDAGLGVKIKGDIANLKSNDLGRFWPYSMASDGYNWVTANIREGSVPSGNFEINLPAGAIESGEIPKGAVKLSFSLEGASTDYYAELPKVTNISGKALLTESQVQMRDLTGMMGDLRVTSDNVLIYGFDKPDQAADIDIQVEGSNKDIFTFLDLPSLGFATPYGIVPSKMTGEGVVKASLKFPLKDDLTMERLDFKAEGDLENAFIPDVGGDIDLYNGDLKVKVDPKGIDIVGTADLNGVPFNLTAKSWFFGEREGYRAYDLTGVVDTEGRNALGLDNDFIDGSTDVSAKIELRPDGSAYGDILVDVTAANIHVDPLHWSKKPGEKGKISGKIASGKDGIVTLSDIAFSAGNLEATGNAVVVGNLVTEINASSVRYDENDFNFVFTQAEPGAMDVKVEGRQFDLKPFVVATYDLNEAEIDGIEKDRKIDIEINIDKLLLDHDVSLDAMKARLRVEGSLIVNARAKGTISEGKHANFDIRKQGVGRKVTFITNDAGSLLKGLDLYDNLREGDLKLEANIDDTKEGRPAAGSIEMTEARVVNAPVLGKILTIGSLGGIVDLLRGEGIVFATIGGPFTYENGIFTTRDFRAIGSIGITVNGTVDQPANKIDAFGTVIPSYTLNSVLGNIPILGTLLVGKKGEGIFGFSYKVTGGLDDPQTSVNAVSALAPGILRRMFFEPWDQPDVEAPTTTKPDSRPSP